MSQYDQSLKVVEREDDFWNGSGLRSITPHFHVFHIYNMTAKRVAKIIQCRDHMTDIHRTAFVILDVRNSKITIIIV